MGKTVGEKSEDQSGEKGGIPRHGEMFDQGIHP